MSHPLSNFQAALAFFKKRVGHCLICDSYESQISSYLRAVDSRLELNDDQVKLLRRCFDAPPSANQDSLVTVELHDFTLIVQKLPNDPTKQARLVVALAAPSSVAIHCVQNAVEAWDLQLKIKKSDLALRESAMQLAQSFEEQNWLRNFAKHASNFSRTSQANEIAAGILEPLVYLLRAEDLFLLTSEQERNRSGLASTKYAKSGYAIQEIEELLSQYHFGGSSKPLVLNNVSVQLAGGKIDSVVAVPVQDATDRGALVAINRRAKLCEAEGDLPVYDHEFGSVEVGILEEAAVLLTTQAHNLQLLLQSNQLFLGAIHAMSSAIDARDRYTQGHSERVARLAMELARNLDLSPEACHEIYLAGILHDIGKIGVPDRVLLKAGRLTDEEFAIIQKHPETGHKIVERMEHLQFTLPGVLHHHERWDGDGYPHGLAGSAIPLMARILAVADAFDAMTSCRPYRSAMPVEKAQRIINEGAAEQWDAEIVSAFNVWFKTRTSEVNQRSISTDSANPSFIPQDRPLEHMALAVTALN